MHTQTIAELSALLERGDASSVELTRALLARIEQHSDLNAFISVTHEQALAAAEVADQRRAAGEATALTGIPLALKDIFCTEGVRTSCASRMLDNFIAPYDATVVQKLKAAGAVSLGKTNMDEFAMGSSNEHSFYGAVKNPWDASKVPGGSSGGSAAAVAARLVPAALGTDTGGSIRQPAALCGITGIKPTYGRVSRYGMIAFASSLDQGGPLAQTAEDCALLLNAIAGFDERDSTSVNRPTEDYTADLQTSLKGKRIGIPKEYFQSGLNSEVEARVREALGQFEALGCELLEISLPNQSVGIPAYYVIAPAEASSNLSRYDGVRFGHRCEQPVDLEDLYKRSRSEGFGLEVKRRILIGTYALSAGYYDAYYRKAQQLRRLISEDYQRAFEQVDFIAGPTTPTTAFAIGGNESDDPVSMYLNDIYTITANLAGVPGISLPCGFAEGLPVGLQLLGQHFSEAALLNAGHQYQQVTEWHRACPEAYR